MHELTLCKSILKLIDLNEKIEKASRINQIDLIVGTLTCIDTHAMQFCFTSITKGTRAADAKLTFEFVQAKALCHNCDAHYMPGTIYSFCPACNSSNTELVEGNDFMLKSVEVQ